MWNSGFSRVSQQLRTTFSNWRSTQSLPTLAPETARGELTQVSDGTVLFTLWKNGTNVRLTRRNLRDVMDCRYECCRLRR